MQCVPELEHNFYKQCHPNIIHTICCSCIYPAVIMHKKLWNNSKVEKPPLLGFFNTTNYD